MLLFLEDIGGGEILLVLLVILVFFGPKSIPGIAKTFGKTIYQIKQASDDLKKEMTKSGLDIKNQMNFDKIIDKTNSAIDQEFVKPIQKEVNEVNRELNSQTYSSSVRADKKDEEAENAEEQSEQGSSQKTTDENVDFDSFSNVGKSQQPEEKA